MKTIFRALVFGFVVGVITGLGMAEYQVWREDQEFRNNPYIRHRLAEHFGRRILEQGLTPDQENYS